MACVLSSPIGRMPTEPENASSSSPPVAPGLGRRRALLAAGAVLAAGVGAAAGELADGDRPPGRATALGGPPSEAPAPFHGARQSGLTSRQLPATKLVAFDLPPTSAAADREALRTLLAGWTRILAAATAGSGPRPTRACGPTAPPG